MLKGSDATFRNYLLIYLYVIINLLIQTNDNLVKFTYKLDTLSILSTFFKGAYNKGRKEYYYHILSQVTFISKNQFFKFIEYLMYLI